MSRTATATPDPIGQHTLETLVSLAERMAAAKKYSSDLAADVAAEAAATLVAEGRTADQSPARLARLVASTVARLHRADTAALQLAADRAGRTDRAPRLDPDTMSTEGRRAAAAAHTAGRVGAGPTPPTIFADAAHVADHTDLMSDDKVTAVLVAHSGAPALRHRPIDRSAFRQAFLTTGPLPAHLASILAPRPVDPETPGSRMARPAAGQWAQVSTDRGTYVDNGSDTGSVRYVRTRQSGTAVGAHTLAAVHSAEQTAIREASADALALAACLPWQPTSRTRQPARQVAAWLALAALSSGADSLAACLNEYARPLAVDRSGARLDGARMNWERLAADLNADPDTVRRTLRGWARAVENRARNIQQARRLRPDLADPFPAWTSAPRPTHPRRRPPTFVVTSAGDAYRLTLPPAATNRPAHLSARTDSNLVPSARTAARATGPAARGEILRPHAWHPRRLHVEDYAVAGPRPDDDTPTPTRPGSRRIAAQYAQALALVRWFAQMTGAPTP